MFERIARESLYRLARGVVETFSDVYLHKPSLNDIQQLYAVHEERHGFPALKDDMNVLDQSPIFDDILSGETPNAHFTVNVNEHNGFRYLVDGFNGGDDVEASIYVNFLLKSSSSHSPSSLSVDSFHTSSSSTSHTTNRLSKEFGIRFVFSFKDPYERLVYDLRFLELLGRLTLQTFNQWPCDPIPLENTKATSNIKV
ncbi:unnamed protein product [Lactuca saligna]|uniref:Uncharacterized protein n=1 Tax=Lactuca saligna TaxID=75948 RepID=A0AA35ZBK1_LACSI|nr:unnamed protein product [Lactuca saligna]